MSWGMVELGDIFNISSSKRVLQKQWKTEGIPFYRAREIVKLSEKGYVENELFISEEHYEELSLKYGVPKCNDIMVSAVGTLGACYIVQSKDKFYYKDASVICLSPKTEAHSKYVQYALRTDFVQRQIHSGSGSTVGTLPISRAQKLKIPLPPLAEQQRIADILDTADTLRQQRRDAIALLDEFLQATFLEMFGDPVTNPKGWTVDELAKWAETNPRFDKSQVALDEFVSFIPMASVSDKNKTVEVYENKELQEVIKGFTPFEKNDVILAKITPCFENGKIAHLKDMPTAIGFGSTEFHVFRTKDSEKLIPEYLFHVLKQPYFYDIGAMKMRGAVGQRRVPISFFENFGLALPPLTLQTQFADIVETVEAQKAQQQAHLDELDALFACLQQRAFSGGL